MCRPRCKAPGRDPDLSKQCTQLRREWEIVIVSLIIVWWSPSRLHITLEWGMSQ
jgi:hypothetical protein